VLDSDSAAFYNEKVVYLVEEKLDWLTLIREQTIVVPSTLKFVNQTLHDVSTNDLTLTWELHKIPKFINVGNKKIENRYALTSLLLTLNDNAKRIRQATVDVRDVHNTVIQVSLHWRNGFI
jgi:hypothetical protein